VVSNFAIRHGEGVAIGLVAAAHLAELMEQCAPELRPRIMRLLQRLDLPVAAPGLSAEAILSIMGHDKKRSGKTLRLVIPQAIGDVVLVDDPGGELVAQVVSRMVAS
jgi:3-dehydroquinate synthetase